MHRAHVILYVTRGMLNHILYTYENNVTIHKDSEIRSTWDSEMGLKYVLSEFVGSSPKPSGPQNVIMFRDTIFK